MKPIKENPACGKQTIELIEGMSIKRNGTLGEWRSIIRNKLLNYFAGKAMQGMVSDLYYTTYGDDGVHGLLADEIAKNAYDLAEAMLKEREKRGIV